MSEKLNRFMTWRDLIITPPVWLATLTIPFLCVVALNHRFHPGLFANIVLFVVLVIGVTLGTLKIIRWMFPPRTGVFSTETDPITCYVWNLIGFLCITNLSFQYMNALIPPPFRKYFYQLLGATMGKGIISIGGRLTDPYLITIEENAMIGDDALLIPHALATRPELVLVLRRITIKKSAMIGARCILMPGVTVGENSMVNAMSLVPMNTNIPPNEVWGGIPATKIKEMKAAD